MRVKMPKIRKDQGSKKQPKQPPIWLRKLDLVRAELKTVRYPRRAAEGFKQMVTLSETARRWFLDAIRQEHPKWSEEQIEQERRLILARWSVAETRWIAQWKEERDRYLETNIAACLEPGALDDRC
jgi:hypothetical protein